MHRGILDFGAHHRASQICRDRPTIHPNIDCAVTSALNSRPMRGAASANPAGSGNDRAPPDSRFNSPRRCATAAAASPSWPDTRYRRRFLPRPPQCPSRPDFTMICTQMFLAPRVVSRDQIHAMLSASQDPRENPPSHCASTPAMPATTLPIWASPPSPRVRQIHRQRLVGRAPADRRGEKCTPRPSSVEAASSHPGLTDAMPRRRRRASVVCAGARVKYRAIRSNSVKPDDCGTIHHVKFRTDAAACRFYCGMPETPQTSGPFFPLSSRRPDDHRCCAEGSPRCSLQPFLDRAGRFLEGNGAPALHRLSRARPPSECSRAVHVGAV